MSALDASARRRTTSTRIAGVDLARAAAIAGMMAVHVLPPGAAGAAGTLYEVAHGRASGLFAVLAGLSLGLTTRSAGGSARARAGARLEVVVRGALVAVLGLALVSAGSRIAVILPYYGLAFVAVLPFLWWPARRLAVVAVGWLLLAPVASYALRAVHALPARTEQPVLTDLPRPGELLQTLLLTGYYPVLGWTGYLLLGLAVSRLDLRAPRQAVQVAGAGALLAGAAWIASGLLLGPAGGGARLRALAGPSALQLQEFYGTVPTTSRWWLAVVAPHSGTPPDLLHTAGTALLVIGLLCLLPPLLTRFLQPLSAFGGMPLSVYTAHVLALAAYPGDTATLLALHVLVGIVLATAWRAAAGRGPLETLVGTAAGGAGALIAPRRPARG
ncbi:heparan-alpha-glucosaminide N-acetyltransferase domain-containing protein [Kineococcus sp. SYSU DK006]|uniref:heparan-alpha-glucosaminide N-acetyltransferase domain-containing protein n=1 Tax=Kineococcus sp. SYSU DK006 TaxID=3383127 RepID=UPI003D7CE79B